MSNRPIRRIFPVLCGLLFVAASVQAATLKDRFDKTVPLKGGSQITLRNVNGTVKVEAWDRDEVRIEADKEVRAGTESAARKFMDQVRIDVTPGAGNNGLRIETKTPNRVNGLWDVMFGNNINYHVNYTLHVPRQAPVDAESVNGGVSLAGTHGKVRLETTNGAVAVQAGLMCDRLSVSRSSASSARRRYVVILPPKTESKGARSEVASHSSR